MGGRRSDWAAAANRPPPSACAAPRQQAGEAYFLAGALPARGGKDFK